jgi:hypothetical protein
MARLSEEAAAVSTPETVEKAIYVEREITLSLLNDKLNHLIGLLEERKK